MDKNFGEKTKGLHKIWQIQMSKEFSNDKMKEKHWNPSLPPREQCNRQTMIKVMSMKWKLMLLKIILYFYLKCNFQA